MGYEEPLSSSFVFYACDKSLVIVITAFRTYQNALLATLRICSAFDDFQCAAVVRTDQALYEIWHAAFESKGKNGKML